MTKYYDAFYYDLILKREVVIQSYYLKEVNMAFQSTLLFLSDVTLKNYLYIHFYSISTSHLKYLLNLVLSISIFVIHDA